MTELCFSSAELAEQLCDSSCLHAATEKFVKLDRPCREVDNLLARSERILGLQYGEGS